LEEKSAALKKILAAPMNRNMLQGMLLI